MLFSQLIFAEQDLPKFDFKLIHHQQDDIWIIDKIEKSIENTTKEYIHPSCFSSNKNKEKHNEYFEKKSFKYKKTIRIWIFR